MQHFGEWASVYEQDILRRLHGLTLRQQVELDMALNRQGGRGVLAQYASDYQQDNDWKGKMLEIIDGREDDPEILRQTIDIIRRDIQTHRRAVGKIGSDEWHRAWIDVYNQWLKFLLGALNAEKGKRIA